MKLNDNRHATAQYVATRHAARRTDRRILPLALAVGLALAVILGLAVAGLITSTSAHAAPNGPAGTCSSPGLPSTVTPKPRMTSTARPSIPRPPSPR